MHTHSVYTVVRKNDVCSLPDKGVFQEEAKGGKEEQAGGYREAPGRVAVNFHFSKIVSFFILVASVPMQALRHYRAITPGCIYD